ncbi:MAG: glycosyltransferase family 4 protein [Anaerolineae bacterium]|nr:glycosyltransferase family 4 protein [Anaerolineae bacterium]
MKIGINAHLLSGQATYRRAGIHHYIFQLLQHLVLPEGDSASLLVFTGKSAPLLTNPHLQVQTTAWPTERRLVRIAWEQLMWPAAAATHHLDLLHSLAFVTPLLTRRPTIVTVYDLSFALLPEQFPLWQRIYLNSQTRRSCRQARRVVAISESGRQDIHRLFGLPLERIDLVYPGVDEHFTPPSADAVTQFRQTHPLPPRFILHVGTLQPRKNLPFLLHVFAQLRQDAAFADVGLVLAGGKGWYYEEIFNQVQALGVTDWVYFPGYVPDEDLPYWYGAAACLVFPSAYEGFGMPIIEAMACGTPVIAANRSSIPEAVGEAGLLYDGEDAAALLTHLRTLLTQPHLAYHLQQKGFIHARRFSWAASGLALAQVYQQALQTSPNGKTF